MEVDRNFNIGRDGTATSSRLQPGPGSGPEIESDVIFFGGLNPNAPAATLIFEPINLMQFFFLPLAMSGADVGMVFGLAGMVFAALFGSLGMYFHHRKSVLWHETARLALEKGQPIPLPPPEQQLWNGDNDRNPNATSSAARFNRINQRRSLIIGGLINIAVGAGLFLALLRISPSAAYFAAIPGFIGVALLIGSVIETILSRNSEG